MNDKQLSLGVDFEDFAWFLEPREAAAYLSAQWQATVRQYVSEAATAGHWHEAARQVDEVAVKELEPLLPSSWRDQLGSSSDDYDDAIVPDEDENDLAYQQGDVNMFGVADDAFSVLKPSDVVGKNKAAVYGGSDMYTDCYSCHQRDDDVRFMRLESDDSGYGYQEEELGVV